MPLAAPGGDGLDAARKPRFAHAQGVQGNVGAAPGIPGGRKVIRIDLAFHLEHLDPDAFRQLGSPGEPGGSSPILQHLPGSGMGIGQGQHLVEGIVDQGQTA